MVVYVYEAVPVREIAADGSVAVLERI